MNIPAIDSRETSTIRKTNKMALHVKGYILRLIRAKPIFFDQPISPLK